MDEASQGLACTFWDAPWDPVAPWPKVTSRRERRVYPHRGGGRRMRHPFHDAIVYPRNPDRTFNFGYDPLRKMTSTVVDTLDSSAVAKFPQRREDVRIREVWVAESLSTHAELFHRFHRYLMDPLPTGRFIGWQPRDLSPRNYFVELLTVECGETDAFLIEELGTERPWMMRQSLTVTFKLVREVEMPAGVMTSTGL